MLKAVFLLGDSTDEAASLLGVPADSLKTALRGKNSNSKERNDHRPTRQPKNSRTGRPRGELYAMLRLGCRLTNEATRTESGRRRAVY